MKRGMKYKILQWLKRRAVRQHNHDAYFRIVSKISKIDAEIMKQEKMKS